jgi:DNA-binding CsgD family transcriptional regulator
MATDRALGHDRVVRVCQSATDARSLRLQLLGEIRRFVPFDAYAWLLTDPGTSVGSSPLADVPCLPELPRLIRLKYSTAVNRWTTLEGEVGLLHQATGGDLSRSLIWRELLQDRDIVDVASVVFRDAFGCWGFLDLWRGRTLGVFSSADATSLSGIAGAVTLALRRCQARTFDSGPDPLGHARPEDQWRGSVMLLLSDDLVVLGQTPETRDYLRVLVPPDEGRAPVPAGAYNVAAQLVATEAGVDGNRPTARVHLSGHRWLTLRAARLEADTRSAESQIAVTIEQTSPGDRLDLFVRSHGLSSREAELLGHLVTGVDTHTLARLMYLSEHTIQDHLKSIFAKTSVHNRRALLSRALGG